MSTAILARLVDAIEAAPRFGFGDDLRRAKAALDRFSLSDAEAAMHARRLIAGARATPGFPFGADIDDAEVDLGDRLPDIIGDEPFPRVATVVDLATLDSDEIVRGYTEFSRDDPMPGANRGRAYWHGWRNAARDHGVIPGDAAMAQLARQFIRGSRSQQRRQT